MKLVLHCFTKNFFNFSGRASKKEYWLLVLTVFIASVLFLMLEEGLFPKKKLSMVIALIGFCFRIATIIPCLAAVVRRLHDTNRTGWWIFIQAIPLIGPIWLLVLLCKKGDPDANNYGNPPHSQSIPNPPQITL